MLAPVELISICSFCVQDSRNIKSSFQVLKFMKDNSFNACVNYVIESNYRRFMCVYMEVAFL